MEHYTIIVFDLDGTLSESKVSIDVEMAGLLCELLKKKKVAVISGASFPQFEHQVLSHLACEPVNFSVLPANGSAFFEYKKGETNDVNKTSTLGAWQLVYEKKLTDMQKVLIRGAMDSVLKKYADMIPEKTYGERLADIGLGMTFSALGQEAPLSEKEKWDPDHIKRSKIVADLQPLLPDIEMTIGGTTSINITVKGADKDHALLVLAEHFSVTKENLSREILYIGDSIFPGGNDYGAIESGVATQKVSGPADTKKLIRDILNS